MPVLREGMTYFDCAETGSILGLAPRTIRRWVQSGAIHGARPANARKHLIRAMDLYNFLASYKFQLPKGARNPIISKLTVRECPKLLLTQYATT